MILSDRDIRARRLLGDLKIAPLLDVNLQIQPASVDLRLVGEFLVYRPGQLLCLDPRAPETLTQATERVNVSSGEAFILHLGEFALGSTAESVAIPPRALKVLRETEASA
jgi:dCTP deaminase